jgi:hypothetical protein
MEDQLMLLSFKLSELQREAGAIQQLIGGNTVTR